VPALIACDDKPNSAHAAAITWLSQDDPSSNVVTVTRAHGVEVRIENGKISIKLDGKEVPADRIRQEGDRIQLLDEHGQPITSLNITQGGNWTGVFGGADGDLFVPFEGWRGWDGRAKVQTIAPPKVMLGVHMDDPGPALEKHLKLEPGKTTMIVAVGKDLAADKAGLQPYDIIVSVDGVTPADQNTIRGLIADREPGQSLHLVVIQAGQRKDINVPLDAYDASRLGAVEWIGQGLQDFSFQLGGTGRREAQNLLVDPERRIFQRVIPPHITNLDELMAQTLQRELLSQENPEGEGEPQQQELDARLNELNDRMAKLEEMIRKLIEQRQR
jgi:hypothetical protein